MDVGGAMTQSGGIASGSTSGTDYLFGKTRILINTTTLVRMRTHATTGMRGRRLAAQAIPFSTIGYGWQDFSDDLLILTLLIQLSTRIPIIIIILDGIL